MVSSSRWSWVMVPWLALDAALVCAQPSQQVPGGPAGQSAPASAPAKPRPRIGPGAEPEPPPTAAVAEKVEHLPIHNAAIAGNLEAIQKELDSGVDINVPVKGGDGWRRGSTALMWAARVGPIESVRFLLEKGADPKIGAWDGTTALMLAVASGKAPLERAQALIAAGSNLNPVCWDGGTPLSWAAHFCAEPGVIQALVSAGARLEHKNPRSGMTPLMIAAKMGNPQAIRDLAAVGADLSAQSNEGFTALHWAAIGERSSPEVIRALVAAGATLEARTAEGSTPLMIAALRGDLPRVRSLLDAGADARAVNVRGDTSAMAAANAGDAGALAAVLDAGADPRAVNRDAVGALHLAVITGDPACVRLLLARGADVRARTALGWTPLLLAKSIAVLEPLLDAGADPNDRAAEPPSVGWTPLMFAAMEGDLFSVRRLLRAGADPEATDLLGATALELALNRPDAAGENAALILRKAMGIADEP